MPHSSKGLLIDRTGSGPPLLLVHGFLGGSFCWRSNLPEFAKHYTVFAIDLPGHGPEEAPPNIECSMQAHAERLLQFLEEERFEHIDVVASSWGGAIAMLLAARCHKVRAMVLAAPVNPWSQFGQGRIRFFSSPLGALLLHLGLPYSSRIHRIGHERMFGDVTRIPQGSVEAYRESLLRKGRAHNILSALRSWNADVEALRAAIPRISSRSLLIWGSRDGAVDPHSAPLLQAALKHCQIAVIPGAGHLPFEETPEVFNRLTLEFFNSSS